MVGCDGIDIPFDIYSGGRVGGVRPPYRDYQIFKNNFVTEFSLLSGGLDTSRKNHAGLLDHRSTKQKAPAMTGAWYNEAHYPMNLVQVCAQVPVLQGM